MCVCDDDDVYWVVDMLGVLGIFGVLTHQPALPPGKAQHLPLVPCPLDGPWCFGHGVLSVVLKLHVEGNWLSITRYRYMHFGE